MAIGLRMAQNMLASEMDVVGHQLEEREKAFIGGPKKRLSRGLKAKGPGFSG